MTIIILEQHKQQCFDQLAEKICQTPEHYLDFDSVSDVYKAKWLNDFPQGTTWAVSGLDDGAEEFCIIIQYKLKKLNIEIYHGYYKINMNV
ncbi:hypothetical protein IAE19_13250 [Acinetobacter sp. S40]|uniref:hypothetical protein n=1 Tax=unclassified Acinetobacter TaxID=196816 RepID=UPI00190BDEAE|nr:MULTISPECIES: hypothetical protein [unclassified Acinetobacter]MBJ9986399.1 hypothetical protein [Acinetobacter sp. S40]MBK0063673.1 hypothetical protein [Acinetobacter sp. S55]MBK0067551.1 hypothetical protein [Acinetobacter sp. S54]